MHSIGSISSRRHSCERPSGRSASRWFGQTSRVRANQKAESPDSTRPLSGISVGSTTSKVEMRSLATSRSRSSPRAKSSRTLPLPTCVAASGMHALLLREALQPLEDGVNVACVGAEIEDAFEVDTVRDLRIGRAELDEVESFVPRTHGVPLDQPVGL